MICNSILDLIGDTPMVRINSLNPNKDLQMYVKLEKFNAAGSVKDRIAKYMIENAEKEGSLTKDKIVIEPTSGNTGIGLALVCRVKGYDCVFVMPETMTMERRQILIALGAKILLTQGSKGMNGAEDYARELATTHPDKYFMPNQFDNKYNILAHYEGTAEEIWKDTRGEITHFVAGLGTSGTIVGVSKRLREHNPNVKVIAVAPDPLTPIQGLKNFNTQYVPGIWEPERADEVHYVTLKDGEESARLLALAEGVFVGPSSGAAFNVALKKAKEIDHGVMVIMAPDGGEKYLSTSLCEPSQCLACAQKFGIKCSYFDGRPVVEARAPPPAHVSP
jgi:S-sulfo-L-cysteine synthase (O-acetyl-L-serine-dependent)